jgi:DNA-binding winged helix-turn-helix (wHTH) protein
MKRALLVGFSLLIVVILISALTFINKKQEASEKHIEVVLREIGHQFLLSAKDSSSRVLPVIKLNETTYRISFQNDLGFISDSLINIVQRNLQKNGLAAHYIVNLKNCEEKVTVLAFEINRKTGDLIPCRGRQLGMGCYVVEIDLLKDTTFNFLWLLLLIVPLALGGYYLKEGLQKKPVQRSVTDNTECIPVGNFKFYASLNELRTDDKTITLSEKETKALDKFVQNINQVVDRDTLMKTLWEAEGTVVISRNVDVLVSKLRKKLSDDDSLKLMNVPGRGYKLMLSGG